MVPEAGNKPGRQKDKQMINDNHIKEIYTLLSEASAAIMEIYESGSFSISQKEIGRAHV